MVRSGTHSRHGRLRHSCPKTDVSRHTDYPISAVAARNGVRGSHWRVYPQFARKRCEMWTEGASAPKSISMQVADVHKALLSLSRFADMGVESRLVAAFGCLIDTVTGEVTQLQRKGNLLHT